MPGQLSGGQQQRVAVARAIVLEPEVLLFDEPLSNLDAKLRRHVRDEIRALQQMLKLTVVYVTHDQQEALAVSDRVVVMNAGRIAQDGSPRELYEQPVSRFVADFIGDANLMPVTVRGIDEATAAVTLGARRCRCRGAAWPTVRRNWRCGRRRCGWRTRAPAALPGQIRRLPISAATWNTRWRWTASPASSSSATRTWPGRWRQATRRILVDPAAVALVPPDAPETAARPVTEAA